MVDTMARAIELHAANGTEPLLNALREAVSAIGDVERAHFHALLWLLTQARKFPRGSFHANVSMRKFP